MRHAAVLLVVLTAGCIPRGVTPAGNPTNVGVLVRGTTGRCTTVLVGATPRRVCAPAKRRAPADTATAPAPADSARVTH